MRPFADSHHAQSMSTLAILVTLALPVRSICDKHGVLETPSHAKPWLSRWPTQIPFVQQEHGNIQMAPESSPDSGELPVDTVHELRDALETMQSTFFELWLGVYPDAIDWTSAVMGAHVSAVLYTLTRVSSSAIFKVGDSENIVNKYFSQIIAYYFSENAFALRYQAYDDMLWVVLGWLEAVKLMNTHSDRHFQGQDSWHGKQFQAAFAHRANVFWELASPGWDTELCDGGMVWSPYLGPYKNAITNELYIAASAAMYLIFPGDNNQSPFLDVKDGSSITPERKPYDRKYLDAAIEGYAWLNSSGMRNQQNLYTDGFHITGWDRNGSIGTGKCDERNEQVYTYNQGVILSGLRGLWEATGQLQYLQDGHKLIRSVIRATGWVGGAPDSSYDWAGLGRNGVLEEFCDSWGDCNQDGQTFKGIFFTYLTQFCEALPREAVTPDKTFGASPADVEQHAQNCLEYTPWVKHNAHAALRTRDEDGVFGEWWGEPPCEWGFKINGRPHPCSIEVALDAAGSEDYRKWGISAQDPASLKWQPLAVHEDRPEASPPHYAPRGQIPQRGGSPNRRAEDKDASAMDANDRGRGRTVESHSGGVAVLRALYELEMLRDET